MLVQITINNFAIIDELDLSLNQGMTVVTGETGAGKSIMVDAIELALGKRANSDIVKHDASRADISIEFDIQKNSEAKTFLIENELDNNDDCFIRRTVYKDGRSKSYINGVPTTQQNLRELSDLLINIHGQHEFQTLLKRDHQLTLLDNFSHHDDLIKKVNALFHQWAEAKKEHDALSKKILSISDRAEYLKFQLKEFEALNLQPDEIETIDQEHQQLANAETLLNHCQEAQDLLTENEHAAASQQLYQALQSIHRIEQYDSRLKTVSELINSAVINIEEASSDLRHFLSAVDLNPKRLAFIEERLAKIHSLSKKHRVPPETLIKIQEEMLTELESLENSDQQLATLKSQLDNFEKEYFIAAEQLSKSRQRASKKLEQMVSDNMQQLGMKGGKFNIAFEKLENEKPKTNGIDKISFLVSANPGQPLQPLLKVASGGELSRISLAIQVITAKHSETPTLIFDEVDAGIGGGTAEVVGKLLKELGESTQTLCVTHLPQVAAKGHHHLSVSKRHEKNTTMTQIFYLQSEQRIQEIARMSGGVTISAETLAHAKAMLDEK